MSVSSYDLIKRRLLPIFESFTPHPDSITDETTMDQLGLDSLDRLELSYEIEDDFCIFFDQKYTITGDATIRSIIADIIEASDENH